MAYPFTSQEGNPPDRVAEVHEKEIVRFWQDTPLADLASHQHVQPIQRLEEILGKGKDLWKDEEEFENFVQDIYQRRKQDRERGE